MDCLPVAKETPLSDPRTMQAYNRYLPQGCFLSELKYK